LLTLRGPRAPRRGIHLRELGVINDGALLIADGAIVEVGPTRRVENLSAARGAIEINAAGRVVMPGFVDSHTHMVFPLPGGSTRDLAGAARAVRAATGQRIQWRTQAHIAAMARHGTTTVEAKTGCGPDESAENKLLRVLAALRDDPLHVVPTFLFRLPSPDVIDESCLKDAAEFVFFDLLPKFQRRRLARFADLAWECDPVYRQIFSRYLETAHRLGLKAKIHADRPGASEAIRMAIGHLAVSIDHLECASDDEAAMLAGCGTMATLLPMASFRTGGRAAPARALIEAGVAVALASNFHPQHTPTLNMQTVVAVACMHLGMTPEEAITAATINGAHTLGRAERVGSLEAGKLADLVMLNIPDYRDLACHFGVNLVHMTMKRGEFIYKEGDVAPRAAEDLQPTSTSD
jgi:imidazolonepropionase